MLIGTLVKWQIILYGTETQPINIKEPQARRPTKPPPEVPGTHGDKENIETSSDHDLMGASSAVDESEYLDYNIANNAISGQVRLVDLKWTTMTILVIIVCVDFVHVCMCVCVCVCACVFLCVHVCICIFLCIYTYRENLTV